MGRRLFSVLASEAGGVSEEALTCACAASEAEASTLAVELLTREAESGAPFAALLIDLLSSHTAAAAEAAPVAHALARGAPAAEPGAALLAWARSQPATLLSLRAALALPPPARPLPPASLEPRGVSAGARLLTPAWAWWLAPALGTPPGAPWALLFSSDAHGRSFRTLSSRCSNRGATLVLVRDSAGCVAAGAADAPLAKRAAFFGGYQSALFSLLPAARAYKPTGANSNCVWYAEGFESVPNGIGFGGQVGHFGLFVSDSMETGHSRMSATFNNQPLMGGTDAGGAFVVDALEVWSIEPHALAEAEEAAARAARRAASGSVLDSHAQERSFLALASGRGSASDGVR